MTTFLVHIRENEENVCADDIKDAIDARVFDMTNSEGIDVEQIDVKPPKGNQSMFEFLAYQVVDVA